MVGFVHNHSIDSGTQVRSENDNGKTGPSYSPVFTFSPLIIGVIFAFFQYYVLYMEFLAVLSCDWGIVGFV